MLESPMATTTTRPLDAPAPQAPTPAPAEAPRSPLAGLLPAGRVRTTLEWLSVVLAVYVLVSAVSVIGAGFKTATGGHAEQLFAFAENPLVALMVGILATAALQSSSTTTSITVGLVAGGLPLDIAIPIVLGANIGTTLTNTLVSVTMIRRRDEFRRAFAAGTVHDFFNLIAVAIFLPLEILTGFLEKLSGWVTGFVAGSSTSVDMNAFDLVGAATSPLKEGLAMATGPLGAVAGGLVMIAVGVGLIFLSIGFVGALLKVLMVGRAKQILHTAIGRGPVTGIGAGALVTTLVQSSSTTTSLMIPLAGSGTFSLRQIYPFTLGANIGTTVTALLAAIGLSGEHAALGMQIALVHLFFNLCATGLVYGVPWLRNLPILGAEWLARVSSVRPWFAFVWVGGVFIALPAALIAITALV